MRGHNLRKVADSLRAISVTQSEAHTAHARLLATKLTPADEISVKALANVADCMARRYRQWATHLEAAAVEMDEVSE